MGCGCTYKGAARYRLGPAYIQQQSEHLRSSVIQIPARTVNLNELSVRKSSYNPHNLDNPPRKNDTTEALNVNEGRRFQENTSWETMRRDRDIQRDRRPEVPVLPQPDLGRKTQSYYQTTIPRPPLRTLQQTSRKVQSRQSPDLNQRFEMARQVNYNTVKPTFAPTLPPLPGRVTESIVTSVAGSGIPFPKPTIKLGEMGKAPSTPPNIKSFDYTKTFKDDI